MPLSEHVVSDYQSIRLTLKAHPMSFLGRIMRRGGSLQPANFAAFATGGACRSRACVDPLALGQRQGVCFITLENETGIANLVVWPDSFAAQQYHHGGAVDGGPRAGPA